MRLLSAPQDLCHYRDIDRRSWRAHFFSRTPCKLGHVSFVYTVSSECFLSLPYRVDNRIKIQKLYIDNCLPVCLSVCLTVVHNFRAHWMLHRGCRLAETIHSFLYKLGFVYMPPVTWNDNSLNKAMWLRHWNHSKR